MFLRGGGGGGGGGENILCWYMSSPIPKSPPFFLFLATALRCGDHPPGFFPGAEKLFLLPAKESVWLLGHMLKCYEGKITLHPSS